MHLSDRDEFEYILKCFKKEKGIKVIEHGDHDVGDFFVLLKRSIDEFRIKVIFGHNYIKSWWYEYQGTYIFEKRQRNSCRNRVNRRIRKFIGQHRQGLMDKHKFDREWLELKQNSGWTIF